MNARAIRLIEILVLTLTLIGSNFSTVQAQDNDVTAFVNVNVIPMDREQVLEAQTVIIEAGIITAIGAEDEIEVPDGAEIIDGDGAYLMPGLADMHMHLQYLKHYKDPKQLLFYLAQGSTTVRSLGTPPGAPYGWREQVKTGELAGPTIYTAGRSFAGNHNNQFGMLPHMLILSAARFLVPVLLGTIIFVIIAFTAKPLHTRQNALVIFAVALAVGLTLELTKTPPFQLMVDIVGESPHAFVADNVAQAKEELKRQQEEWDVDAVKSYDGQEEDIFYALMNEAQASNLYVTGHLLDHVPLDLQLTSGIDEVAHIDEFLSHHWIGYNLGRNPDPAYAKNFNFPMDYSAISQTASIVAENNVAVVSNMSADEALVHLIGDTAGTLAGAEYAAYRPDLVDGWARGGRHTTVFANALEQRRDVEMPFYMALIKALHDEGVLILLGTDSGGSIPEGSIPGHIHRELELLVEAGFSNYDALAAGTKNAGIIVNRMGRDGNFGTVEVGQRADLILIENNPLENVSNTRNRIGVMTRGRWYLQSDLDDMLQALIASF